MAHKDQKAIWGIILSSIMLLMVYAIAFLNQNMMVKPSTHTAPIINAIPADLSGINLDNTIASTMATPAPATKSSTRILDDAISTDSTSSEIDDDIELTALLDKQLLASNAEPIQSALTKKTATTQPMAIEQLDTELKRLEQEANKFDEPNPLNVLSPEETLGKTQLVPEAVKPTPVIAQITAQTKPVKPPTKTFTGKTTSTPDPTNTNKALARLKQMSFKQLTFKFGELTLSDKGLSLVREVSQVVRTHKNINLAVNNYTDSYGDDNFNLKLSKQRAKVIYDAFLAEGVAKRQISYKGYGEANPIASNSNLAGRRINRRTELEFAIEK